MKGFGRERGLLPKVPAMGRKERERLLDKGQELLRVGKVPETPYGGEMEDQAWSQRRSTTPSQGPPVRDYRPNGLWPPETRPQAV